MLEPRLNSNKLFSKPCAPDRSTTFVVSLWDYKIKCDGMQGAWAV